MDTTRLCEGGTEFQVLGLTARVAFRSQTSISFDLGRWTTKRSVFTHVGWIDVHHPCDGHIKAHLRIQIPAKYLAFDQMKSISDLILEALAIPSDETYEAMFFTSDHQHVIEQPIDRTGVTDRLPSGRDQSS